jgi:hypothetical protein
MRSPLRHLALGLCLTGCVEGGDLDVVVLDPTDAEVLVSEVPFDRIRDMSVVGNVVWVLDRSPPYLTRISLDDGSTLRFGDEGSGPGELVDPVAIDAAEGPAAAVIVWDLTANRASTFAADGRLLRTEQIVSEEVGRSRGQIQDLTYAEPRRIRALEAGVVAAYFPGIVRRTADVPSGSLRLADEHLSPRATLRSFADLTPRTGESMLEFASVPSWDACAADLVVWDPREERVLWLDATGAERHAAEVSLEPAEVRRTDVERFLAAMLRIETGSGPGPAARALVEEHMDRFARRAPLVTDVRCDAKGTAWLRGFDTSTDPVGRGSSWIRVDRYGGAVEFDFPEGFHGMAFTEADAIGVEQDKWGLQRVVRWSLPPTGA